MSASAEDSAFEFLAAHSESAVYKEYGDIRGCLPPDLSIESVASAGNLLRSIYAEAVSPRALDPCRIFWIREKPLVQACDGQSEEAMENAKLLADYTLLPAVLVALIDQHRACRRVLAESPLSDAQLRAERDSGKKFFDLLRAQPELEPLVKGALAVVEKVSEMLCWPLVDYVFSYEREDDFFRGLLGANVEASTHNAKQAVALCCGFLFAGRKLPDLAGLLPPRRDWRHHAFVDKHNLRCVATIASAFGRLDVLKQLRRRPLKYRTTGFHVVQAAATFGHLDILEWASRSNAHHFRTCDAVLIGAASRGADGLPVAKWWFETKKLPCPVGWHGRGGHDAMGHAAHEAADPIPFIRYLRSKGCEWFSNFFLVHVARRSMFELFRYMYEDIGAPEFPDDILEDALDGGSMEILLYALQNGASWDDGTQHYWNALGKACEGFKGNIAVLAEIVSLGAPTDRKSVQQLCYYAVIRRHLAVLDRFVPTLPGFPGWKELAAEILSDAVHADTAGALEAVRWLLKQEGVDPPSITGFSMWDADVLIECPMEAAVKLGSVELAQLIYDNKVAFDPLLCNRKSDCYTGRALEVWPASEAMLRFLFSRGFLLSSQAWARCLAVGQPGSKKDSPTFSALIEGYGLDFSKCREDFVEAAVKQDRADVLEYVADKGLYELDKLVNNVARSLVALACEDDADFACQKVIRWLLRVGPEVFRDVLLENEAILEACCDEYSGLRPYRVWARVEAERAAAQHDSAGGGAGGAASQ